MGLIEDAKETAEAVAKKAGRAVEDGVDRAKDKVDELKADAAVKKAEMERDATRARSDAKERMRD